jgi:predicted RNA-binding protein Jag
MTASFETLYECESAEDVEQYLRELLDDTDPSARVSTYEEDGVLTHNRGLVVRAAAAEFQITIVQSR